jgi:peptidoglycan/xylan/chitin deacetylase (PgdA/CDA1 family)
VRARTAAAIGAVGAAAWSAPGPAPVVPAIASALGIPRRLASARGVALTFDDGPHAEGTPAVLEALDRTGATATFFLVGEQVERRPTLAAEIAAAGHEVATHGYSHRLHLVRTPRALRDDLQRALATIEDAIAAETAYYRPPYGVFSWASLEIVHRSGQRPLLWSRWGRDWRRSATPKAITEKATAGLGPGDVVLLHDADYYSSFGSWRKTVSALPEIVDRVAELGEPLVSVTQST